MRIPEIIRRHLPDDLPKLDDIGCSDAKVWQYADRVLKMQPVCDVSEHERDMLQWMQGRVPAPEVIAATQADGLNWLLMTRARGVYLCAEETLDDQHLLAERCAEALKLLWSADVSGCPRDRTLPRRLAEIEQGLRQGTITRDRSGDPTVYEGPGSFASPVVLFDWLVKHQPEEEPVLTHGDCCLPNIFADDAGITAFIDVGCAGVADRWVDIEKLIWSMWANTTGFFGGKQRRFDKRLLFDALQMEPDEDRMRYYGLLDNI